MGLVPSLQPAKPAVRLGGTHVLWARCRARVSGLFWGRTGDGTQGLGHGRHTLCPWVHLPHFVLLTQPAWVLGKLAGASHFPLVVFPAWFPVRCAWFSLATSGLGWAGGQDLGARHTCSGGVRGARATPMFALDQAQVQQLFVFSTCTHCLRVFSHCQPLAHSASCACDRGRGSSPGKKTAHTVKLECRTTHVNAKPKRVPHTTGDILTLRTTHGFLEGSHPSHPRSLPPPPTRSGIFISSCFTLFCFS